MKQFILIIVGMLMVFSVNAQWVTKGGITYIKPYGSYIGIGTDKPSAQFEMTGLPNFLTAAGQLTVNTVFDTVGVNITGLTTSAIVIVSYGEAVGAADTIASVYSLKAGRLTVMGERGKKINYFIPKK